MELLDCMMEIVAFFLLIQWTTSDSSSLGIVATCNKVEHRVHKEWFENNKSYPSPLHELSAELNESQTSIIIRWSINIDNEVQWNADIYSVLHGDKIVVTFNTSLVADRHTIVLTNSTYLPLRTVGGKGECKVEKCEVKLDYMEYMGPCEDLTIWIKPHFKDCQDESEWKDQKVNCTSVSSSPLTSRPLHLCFSNYPLYKSPSLFSLSLLGVLCFYCGLYL
uniref:Uncharacterized protein n=1 Tax=Cyprinus carpio TaxID=7962 RepID=A0A8C1P150_CYPCA